MILRLIFKLERSRNRFKHKNPRKIKSDYHKFMKMRTNIAIATVLLVESVQNVQIQSLVMGP